MNLLDLAIAALVVAVVPRRAWPFILRCLLALLVGLSGGRVRWYR